VFSFSGLTDPAGNYTVLSMPPGTYSVTAAAPGFAEARINHAVLTIDQHMVLDFRLKVGDVTSSVEVSDAPPVLQNQSAEVGTVIGGIRSSTCPLRGAISSVDHARARSRRCRRQHQ